VTTVERTIQDCIEAHVSREFIAQAIDQAGTRGLVRPARLRELERAAGLGR